MYVIVRETILSNEDQYNAAHQEFARILAQTPGLRGTLSLDAGEGRHVSIAVWDSAASAQAAGPDLGPHYQRLLAPHTASSGRVVYEGPMVTETLMTR
jgi:hypothetical protein